MNVRGRKAERNKDEVRKLSQMEGNKFCLDCGMRGPLYVVHNFHIFVCSMCAALHRSLQHKVKGISMTEFTDEEVAGLRVGGNDRASAVWLRSFNGIRPKQGDETAMRNFISRAFDDEMYLDLEELKRFQEDLRRALHPETVPSSSSPAPVSFSAPPAAQLSTRDAYLSQPQPQTPPVKEQVAEEDAFNDFFSAPAPVTQVSNVAPATTATTATTTTVKETIADLFASSQVKDATTGVSVPDSSLYSFNLQQSSVPLQQQQQQQQLAMQHHYQQTQQQQQPNQTFPMQCMGMQSHASLNPGECGYGSFVSPQLSHLQQQQQYQQPMVPFSAPVAPSVPLSNNSPWHGGQPLYNEGYQNLGNMNFFEAPLKDPSMFPGSINTCNATENPRCKSQSQKGEMHDNSFASLDPFRALR